MVPGYEKEDRRVGQKARRLLDVQRGGEQPKAKGAPPTWGTASSDDDIKHRMEGELFHRTCPQPGRAQRGRDAQRE